jgi:hypothetical protein
MAYRSTWPVSSNGCVLSVLAAAPLRSSITPRAFASGSTTKQSRACKAWSSRDRVRAQD